MENALMAAGKEKKEKKIRLDRFLANAGIGTRTEVKNYISKGQITVNGSVVKDAAGKVDPLTDIVCWGTKQISGPKDRYYLFYKPQGCITAVTDEKDKTVLDFFPEELRRDLFPVGRLDKDTEGLLLLTTDGPLGHALLSPAHHVDKCYYVRLDGELSLDEVEHFKNGVDIGDEKLTLPATLEILRKEAPAEAKITICEGRYHQVKRMFAKAGAPVVFLKRISFGPLVLDEAMEKGTYRELSSEEVSLLAQAAKKKKM